MCSASKAQLLGNSMIQDIISIYNDRNSVYGDNLTNHLNMGLFAMYKMGASKQRLHSFATNYIDTKNVSKAGEVTLEINDYNYIDYLGTDKSYSSYIPYFKNKLNKNNPRSVLSEFLNVLLLGSSGGAFHGIIRLAYAVELGSLDELAKALSYMAECYQEFPIEYNKLKIVEPMEAITVLSENDYYRNKKLTRPLIVGRMMDIYEDERTKSVLTLLPDEYCNDKTMSQLLLKIYGMTNDFTMLHGFTSTHALRILKPFIDNYINELRKHWCLLQITYLSTNCKAIGDMPTYALLPKWESIFSDTLLSTDVHTIKIVYSLYEQSLLVDDDSIYRAVAQKKLNIE